MSDDEKRLMKATARLVRAAARAGNLDVAEWLTRQLLAQCNRARYAAGKAACMRNFNTIRRIRRRATA